MVVVMELALFVVVVFLGILSTAEAWCERDVPWECGKYFLLFLAGFLFFVFH
jgi:hypothetical protein